MNPQNDAKKPQKSQEFCSLPPKIKQYLMKKRGEREKGVSKNVERANCRSEIPFAADSAKITRKGSLRGSLDSLVG